MSRVTRICASEAASRADDPEKETCVVDLQVMSETKSEEIEVAKHTSLKLTTQTQSPFLRPWLWSPQTSCRTCVRTSVAERERDVSVESIYSCTDQPCSTHCGSFLSHIRAGPEGIPRFQNSTRRCPLSTGLGEKFLGMKMIWPRMSKSTFKYSHYKSIEEGTMAGHMREIARVSRSQLPHSHSSSRRNMIKYMIDNLAPSLDSASRLVLASAQPAGGSSPFSEGAGRPSHPRARGHDRSLRAL